MLPDARRKFNGARKGCIFQKGHMGTGYYRDLGPMAKGRAPVRPLPPPFPRVCRTAVCALLLSYVRGGPGTTGAEA